MTDRLTNQLPPVEDDQIINVAIWEMARALYSDTMNFPHDKTAEWKKLIEGPNWLEAEGYKRMATRCYNALMDRNFQVVNRCEYSDNKEGI